MKKDMSFKKVIVTLAIIMVLTFSGIAVVLGDGGSSGSGAGGDGQGKTCASCSCHYDRTGVFGVRLSLVDWETGKKLASTKSIDVFASNEIGSLHGYGNKKFYTIKGDNAGKYNRMEMLESVITQTTTNPTLDTLYWSEINKYTASDLGWDTYSSTLSFNFNNMETMISYETFVVSLYNIMVTEVAKYKESGNINDIALTNKLFTTLGINQLQTYSIEQLEGIHLAIEPIVTISIEATSNATLGGYNMFYGTPTQLAYAFQQNNCDSDEWQDWSLSDSILKHEFNVVLYATKPCNTTGDQERCTPTNWPAVTKPTGNGRSIREALTKEKASYGIGYIWLGDLGVVPQEGCDLSVGYLNDSYKNGKITKTQYKNYINQVISGTFDLTDSATGQTYKVTEPQSWELLEETNYTKYNGGYAACSNIPTGNQDCEAAIDYINSNYLKGTDAYHDAVAQVRNGTFEYETYVDGVLTKVKVDKAYNDEEEYAMLIKSIYTKTGGEAKCEPVDDICALYSGATVEIDDCTTGKTYFKDIEDEEAWLTCEIAYTKDGTIYSSDNTGHDAVETTNGGIVGNTEYCEVFCYEDFETTFPTHVYDVKAGQTFTWGSTDGIFGSVKITKKCSTQTYIEGVQGYRFDEWEEDYKDNEEALVKYYMKKGAYEEAADSVYATGSGSYYTCDWKCFSTCGEAPNTYPCSCRYTGCKRYWGTAASTAESESYTHSYLGTITASVSSDSSYVSGYLSSSAAKQAAKDTLESELLGYANTQYANYTGKLNSEKILLEKIRQCTNNIEYLYETAIRFTFSEPVNSVYGANSRNFTFDGELVVDGTFNENNVDTSQCTQKTVYSYTCSGTGSSVNCTPTTQKVWDCTMVKWNINGTYTYRYPTDKFQWYSLKTNATLVNEENKGSEDEAFFYSIGFGLPTAFSLTDGTYELKVTVDNIGDNATTTGAQQYNVDDGHFAPLANAVNALDGSGYGFDYSCTYEVENDMFGHDCQYGSDGQLTSGSPEYCDNDKDEDSEGSLVGIDITYRLITLLSDGDSLDKAFPSIDGTGREPASNWKAIGEDELRKILDADIYNNDRAMYEIMLDVNAIQKIREDNETYFDAGKDPYTSYYDANNAQKVYCVTGSGQQKYCASDFISDLHAGNGLNYKLLGTCLPTSNTLERAEYVLENGCDTFYTYPAINWTR